MFHNWLIHCRLLLLQKMAWVNCKGSTEDVSFEEEDVKAQINTLETEVELR